MQLILQDTAESLRRSANGEVVNNPTSMLFVQLAV